MDRNIPSPVRAPAKAHQPRYGQEPVRLLGCNHKGAVAPRDDTPLLGLSLETQLRGGVRGGGFLEVPTSKAPCQTPLFRSGSSAFST